MEGTSRQYDHYQQEWALLQKEKEIIQKDKELLERERDIMTLQHEMQQLKQIHAKELRNLEDIHCRNIAKIIDRYQKDLIKAKADSVVNQKLIEEKNNLAKTCNTMRILVDTMMRYFVIREDEADKTFAPGIFRDEKTSESANSEKVMETDENGKVKSSTTKETQEYSESELKIQRIQDTLPIVELVASGSSDIDTSQNIGAEHNGKKADK